MTILQVTSSSSHSGGTRQAILLCGGLRQAGHKVILCAPPGSRGWMWAQAHGLETRRLTFGSLWGQWKASRELRVLAAREKVDVVHAHHTKGHNVALLATFGGGFPPIIANRGVLYRPELPLKFRSARTSAIITNSVRVKRVLEQSGVPGRKIHVVYNAAEIPNREQVRSKAAGLRRELALGDGGPIIGAVGSGDPDKGLQYLVEAAPAILGRYPETIFVLVGPGTEVLTSRLDALGVRNCFRVTGFREDVRDLMGIFDLFALPSVDKESCPNVLLEAMAAGLPAVASDVGGVSEMLDDGRRGRRGWLVSPGRPDKIAGAVFEVLATQDRGRRVGALARKYVQEAHSLDRKTEGTLRVYASVLGLNAPPR
jgi:glycosyltransferase involved in cell wall biosynthesis